MLQILVLFRYSYSSLFYVYGSGNPTVLSFIYQRLRYIQMPQTTVFFCNPDYFEECVAAAPSESLIAGCRQANRENSYMNTYINQVYDDSRTRTVAASNKEDGEISMIYTDIGVAKLNHFVSVISPEEHVLVEPFKFLNDFEGFRSLSLVLDKYDREQLLIGLEPTDH